MNDEPLGHVVEKHCLLLMESNASFISAGDVAVAAYGELDPERRSPSLVAASCQNDLRRRAEAALRALNAQAEKKLEDVQSDAFSDLLQEFYPVEREGMHGYVPRSEMSASEIETYVNKLRKEASAKLKHADALEAYGAHRNR